MGLGLRFWLGKGGLSLEGSLELLNQRVFRLQRIDVLCHLYARLKLLVFNDLTLMGEFLVIGVLIDARFRQVGLCRLKLLI